MSDTQETVKSVAKESAAKLTGAGIIIVLTLASYGWLQWEDEINDKSTIDMLIERCMGNDQ